MQKKQKERKFLEQLLDGKKVENYTIPVPIKAELRKYQQVSPFMLGTGPSGSVRLEEVPFSFIIQRETRC